MDLSHAENHPLADFLFSEDNRADVRRAPADEVVERRTGSWGSS